MTHPLAHLDRAAFDAFAEAVRPELAAPEPMPFDFATDSDVMALLERGGESVLRSGRGVPDGCCDEHACGACVDESDCGLMHQLSLGICDDHIREWIAEAREVAGIPDGHVIGAVMRRSGGKANPARVAELVRGPAKVLIPRPGLPVQVVVSGGQTGADRGGHDAALAVGLPIDGYCPKGRKAEDGTIPEQYTLTETGTEDYGERTNLNAQETTATLLLAFHDIDDNERSGTGKTLRVARKAGKRTLCVNLAKVGEANYDRVAYQVFQWLRRHKVIALNVAGPRESKAPGLQAAVAKFLTMVLGVEVDAEKVREESVIVPAAVMP